MANEVKKVEETYTAVLRNIQAQLQSVLAFSDEKSEDYIKGIECALDIVQEKALEYSVDIK